MSAPAEEPKVEQGKATVPPWQETRLARYPRKHKIAAVIGFLVVIIAPWFVPVAVLEDVKKLQPEISSESGDTSNGIQLPDTAEHALGPADFSGEALNDQDDRNIKMVKAPDTGLSEDTREGSLPRIGEDGRQPWQIYARPFNTSDRRPRIAIVVVDLGLSRVTTDAAINRLPANVTLAFDAQSPVIGAWNSRARQDGHETLMMIPMEPFDYPRSDPGPNVLLTNVPNTDNLARLYNSLRQASGYVGIMTLSGSRFTTDPDKLAPVLDVLRKRGLMIFDARIAPHSAIMDMARNQHVPAVASTLRIDQNPSPEAIDASLAQLEKTARLTGHAVGIISALPVSVDRLQVWLKDLPQRGIALAPLSAMVQ
ncbi:MAG: divergent polysaccharide deacetylase family protein [Alphaproteobacteria bacterium]